MMRSAEIRHPRGVVPDATSWQLRYHWVQTGKSRATFYRMLAKVVGLS